MANQEHEQFKLTVPTPWSRDPVQFTLSRELGALFIVAAASIVTLSIIYVTPMMLR